MMTEYMRYLFEFKGRVNRIEYSSSSFGLMLLFLIGEISYHIPLLFEAYYDSVLLKFISFALWFFLAITSISLLSFKARRLHDFNFSVRWMLPEIILVALLFPVELLFPFHIDYIIIQFPAELFVGLEGFFYILFGLVFILYEILLFLAAVFYPGTKGANKYGDVSYKFYNI